MKEMKNQTVLYATNQHGMKSKSEQSLMVDKKTSDRELISVEEYFDTLRERVNKHYENLQG
jgi:hypothetical protein